MNIQFRTIARLAAVASALTLLACYVANSQRKAALQNPTVAPGSKSMDARLFAPQQRTLAPGSKSGAVVVPAEPPRTFIPGSKSAPVGPFTLKNNTLTVPAEPPPARQAQP
ncbi:MAG: hypothetical protein RL088_41 [Verrucomicrobiota bacterium]|jgi:hypothetical protein